MIGQQSPIAAILTLQHGQGNGVWVLTPPVIERLSPEVEKHLLRFVLDHTDSGAVHRGSGPPRPGNAAEDHQARDYLLTHARKVKPEDLARIADRGITYANLHDQPDRYRGAAVHLNGLLRLVRRQDPPLSLRNDPDVKALYEAWIVEPDDLYSRYPYCVLLSELPPGIEPSTKSINIPVTCDAYFFKLLQYQARGSDPKGKEEWHEAPMLVGRTLQLAEPPAEPENPLQESMRNVVLPIIVASTFAVILVGAVLLLFFRRGDLAVNARLKETREAMFVDPSTTAPPAATSPPERPPQAG
jgi:hypothetical protein